MTMRACRSCRRCPCCRRVAQTVATSAHLAATCPTHALLTARQLGSTLWAATRARDWRTARQVLSLAEQLGLGLPLREEGEAEGGAAAAAAAGGEEGAGAQPQAARARPRRRPGLHPSVVLDVLQNAAEVRTSPPSPCVWCRAVGRCGHSVQGPVGGGVASPALPRDDARASVLPMPRPQADEFGLVQQAWGYYDRQVGRLCSATACVPHARAPARPRTMPLRRLRSAGRPPRSSFTPGPPDVGLGRFRRAHHPWAVPAPHLLPLRRTPPPHGRPSLRPSGRASPPRERGTWRRRHARREGWPLRGERCARCGRGAWRAVRDPLARRARTDVPPAAPARSPRDGALPPLQERARNAEGTHLPQAAPAPARIVLATAATSEPAAMHTSCQRRQQGRDQAAASTFLRVPPCAQRALRGPGGGSGTSGVSQPGAEVPERVYGSLLQAAARAEDAAAGARLATQVRRRVRPAPP